MLFNTKNGNVIMVSQDLASALLRLVTSNKRVGELIAELSLDKEEIEESKKALNELAGG